MDVFLWFKLNAALQQPVERSGIMESGWRQVGVVVVVLVVEERQPHALLHFLPAHSVRCQIT